MSVVQHAIADGIGHITLNRPERMNAVTTELARQLEHALNELSSDPAVNVIVIRGRGKKLLRRRRCRRGRTPQIGGPRTFANAVRRVPSGL